jgi:hypothetical protein
MSDISLVYEWQKYFQNDLILAKQFIGSSFDDFLVEEGIYEEVEARAIKKIISYQLLETIEK